MRIARLVALAACHGQVAQDRATSPDGVIEGAQSIAIANGIARTTGTVSYPYGDRVDWFVIDLPETAIDVEVEMQWKPKSKGSRAGLEVWNDNYKLVGRQRGHRRRFHIFPADKQLPRHKLFVRVYALERDDAGTYAITVSHREALPPIDWLAIAIDEPPPLPSVPDSPRRCANGVWDRKLGRCVDHPCGTPNTTNPECEPATPSHRGRVIKMDSTPDGLVLAVGIGSNHSIEKTWVGHVINEAGDNVAGGEVVIIRVDKNVMFVRVKLTAEQITANPYVRVEPP